MQFGKYNCWSSAVITVQNTAHPETRLHLLSMCMCTVAAEHSLSLSRLLSETCLLLSLTECLGWLCRCLQQWIRIRSWTSVSLHISSSSLSLQQGHDSFQVMQLGVCLEYSGLDAQCTSTTWVVWLAGLCTCVYVYTSLLPAQQQEVTCRSIPCQKGVNQPGTAKVLISIWLLNDSVCATCANSQVCTEHTLCQRWQHVLRNLKVHSSEAHTGQFVHTSQIYASLYLDNICTHTETLKY